MNPQLPDLREIAPERRQAALGQAGRSPRTFESWAEPPYEILCPLAYHEVPDISRWDHLHMASKLDSGAYVCQPLFGWFKEIGAKLTPCWVLALRILLGPNTEKILFRSFWLSERAIERSTADLRRLGLPLSVARQTVEFDRGGVLVAVAPYWSDDFKDLPYKISSLSTMLGIAALHAEFLDYERAKSEQVGIEREPHPLPAGHPDVRAADVREALALAREERAGQEGLQRDRGVLLPRL